MTIEQTGAVLRLSDRSPSITGAEIAAELVPPPQFEHASF
ncbi:MAG: cell division protein ZapE, partial [Microbacteriaceae bacterium]|nr:cell division protein ZapE [Microbacteriaceae bacterium]